MSTNGKSVGFGSIGPAIRWTLYVIGIGTWLSGGLWLAFHYFLQGQGELGPHARPLEPWLLKMHGAFAFGAIWIFGLLYGVHIARTWQSRQRRGSGILITGTLAWLILSGYLLYYVGDDDARSIISVIHWAVGLLMPICFAVHRVSLRKRFIFQKDLLPAQGVAQLKGR